MKQLLKATFVSLLIFCNHSITDPETPFSFITSAYAGSCEESTADACSSPEPGSDGACRGCSVTGGGGANVGGGGGGGQGGSGGRGGSGGSGGGSTGDRNTETPEEKEHRIEQCKVNVANAVSNCKVTYTTYTTAAGAFCTYATFRTRRGEKLCAAGTAAAIYAAHEWCDVQGRNKETRECK